MRKIFTLSILLILICQNTFSQIGYGWAYNATDLTGATALQEVKSVKTDSYGNVYALGNFQGTVDFDFSTNIVDSTTSPLNVYDIFLAKYDASGNLVFVRQMGGTGDDRGLSLALDNSGNIFITGYFNNGAKLIPGSSVQTPSVGLKDIFVSKFSNSGAYISGFTIGSTTNDEAYSIAIDNNNNVLLSGYFGGTTTENVDFNPAVDNVPAPGNGINYLTTNGSLDAFFAKYDNNLNHAFAYSIGGAGADNATSIAHDNLGNIIIAGAFWGANVDFNPSISKDSVISSTTNSDVFVAKYSNSGDFILVRNLVPNTLGAGADIAYSLVVDNGNNFYITGFYNGTLTVAGSTLISAGGQDIFLVKYDSSGTPKFAKRMGSSSNDVSYNIVIDQYQHLYITGYFRGNADFGPFNLTNGTDESIFVVKLDTLGNYKYAYNFGSTFADRGNSVAVTSDGCLILGGYFNSTVDFDPSTDVNYLNAVTGSDMFLAKYEQFPEINVKGNNISIPDENATTIEDDFTNFGSTGMNTSLDKIFTIENVGNNVLNLSNITVTGECFSLKTNANPTVNPDNSVTFEVRFTPVSCLTYDGQISIANSDSDENPYNFAISGTGLDNVGPNPSLTTLPDVTAQCEVTELTEPTATDNCSSIVTVSNNVTLPITTQGTTIVTWTFDDGNGNTSTQNQNVIIDDTYAPIPTEASLPYVTAQCEVTELTEPTASDDCSNIVTVTKNVTLPITIQGTTVVTWTFDDGNGNTTTQTQNVVIDDNIAPEPNLPSLDNVTAICEVTELTAPTATDICSSTITVTNNATFPITSGGTTVVTWTYDDGNGNTITQNQNVIITDDIAPIPTITNLNDVTAQCEVTELEAPTATDNCTTNVVVTNNAVLPITNQGTTIITWTYDDGKGNTSTQNQNVIIDDTYAPIPTVASLPDIFAQCEVTELTTPTASDNCSSNVVVTSDAILPIINQGTTVVTWTFDDGNENTIIQTQNVVIEDDTEPSIICIDNQTKTLSQGQTFYTTSGNEFDPISFSDNCESVSITNNFNNTGTLLNAQFPIGETTVIWTATDDAGNSTSCSFVVSINEFNNISDLLDKNLTVYPNPSDGIFVISSSTYDINNLNYLITDVSGKVVIYSKLTSNNHSIDLSDYSKGVYFLKIYSQNLVYVTKIILE